jgi:DNA-binding NarL/FixJ family response regulator
MRDEGEKTVPRIDVVLATSSAALFDRLRALLLDRPEVALRVPRIDEPRVVPGLRLQRPDVALVDGYAYGERAVRMIRRVRALDLPTKTLMLDPSPTDVRVARVLECGGAGCLATNCSAFELVRAVQSVHAGELWASRKALASALRHAVYPSVKAVACDADAAASLSPREREIAEFMRKGMTNKEIARLLGISDMTVKTHAQNIFQKLEIPGRRLLTTSVATPEADANTVN